MAQNDPQTTANPSAQAAPSLARSFNTVAPLAGLPAQEVQNSQRLIDDMMKDDTFRNFVDLIHSNDEGGKYQSVAAAYDQMVREGGSARGASEIQNLARQFRDDPSLLENMGKFVHDRPQLSACVATQFLENPEDELGQTQAPGRTIPGIGLNNGNLTGVTSTLGHGNFLQTLVELLQNVCEPWLHGLVSGNPEDHWNLPRHAQSANEFAQSPPAKQFVFGNAGGQLASQLRTGQLAPDPSAPTGQPGQPYRQAQPVV